MPDGYSRWREDFAAKDPAMIETGVFYRRCPCCKSELEVKLSPERDDIEIKGQTATPPANAPQIEAQEAPHPIPAPVADRKCAYCFRTAIRGGVLCREHAFCRECEAPFPDGKPFEIKEFPTCQNCSK